MNSARAAYTAIMRYSHLKLAALCSCAGLAVVISRQIFAVTKVRKSLSNDAKKTPDVTNVPISGNATKHLGNQRSKYTSNRKTSTLSAKNKLELSSSKDKNGMKPYQRKPFERAKFSALKKLFMCDYVSFHASHRHDASSRKLVFIPFKGGFGNIFGAIATTYYFSVLSRRVMLIEYEKFQYLDAVLSFPSNTMFFHSEGDKKFEKKNSNSVLWINDRKRQKEGKMELVQYLPSILASDINTIKVRHGRNSELSQVFSYWHMISNNQQKIPIQLSQMQQEEMKHMVFQHVFKPSKEVRSKYEKYALEMNLQKRHYVAAHARVGAGVQEGDNNRFTPLLQNIDTVARCLARVATEKLKAVHSDTIFLATDTPEFRLIFEKAALKFNSSVRVLHPTWGHTGHVNRMSGNRRECVLNTFAEILLIGEAKTIVHLPSSFPRVAFQMGDADSSVEVDPDRCSSITIRKALSVEDL